MKALHAFVLSEISVDILTSWATYLGFQYSILQSALEKRNKQAYASAYRHIQHHQSRHASPSSRLLNCECQLGYGSYGLRYVLRLSTIVRQEC